MSNKKFHLNEIDRPEVELPPNNQNKDFKYDPEAMKKLADELKVAVQIYKFNMTKQPAHYDNLRDFFGDSLEKSLVFNLESLSSWGMIESSSGPIGEDRVGKLYYIDSGEVQLIRRTYETDVKPFENPEDQIDYVPNLLIKK